MKAALDPTIGQQPQTPTKASQAKAAGQQLEAFFLRQLLSEARPQGGSLDSGFAGDTFKQMLDTAISDKMAGAGGIGMAEMFSKQLDKGAELPATGSVAPIELGSVDGLPQISMPVPGRIGSGYGLRVGHTGTTHMHQGLDLFAQAGDKVAAAAPGVVEHAGPAGTYGNLVTIRHPDGYETRYAHLSATEVSVGDHVVAGQEVGKVGSTGLSDGPHLHFELRKQGQSIDPTALFRLNGSRTRASR